MYKKHKSGGQLPGGSKDNRKSKEIDGDDGPFSIESVAFLG